MFIRKITARPFLSLVFSIFCSTCVFGASSVCSLKENSKLCEKVGQMLIVGFGGFKQDKNGKVLWNDKNGTEFSRKSLIAKHINVDHVGGVILFIKPARDVITGKFIRDRNIQNPSQVTALNKALQEYNAEMRKTQQLENLPLFIGIDQEGGRIDRLPAVQGFAVATLLPQAFGAKEQLSIKKSKVLNETYEYAEKIAIELATLGFNLNFAPVVDVNINPTNPIIGGLGRSFSSDPKVVVAQAQQFIKAFHKHKIVAALKHFAGHGSSSADTHIGLVDVTNSYQKSKELYPYFTLIRDGYSDMVMTTHVINGQLDKTQCKIGAKNDNATWCPGTMSKKVLTDLLRNTMKFQGIIVSDDMTMGAIEKEYQLKESLKNAINAGVDIFIIANNYADQTNEVIDTIVGLVRSKEVKEKLIDDAYRRIVLFKQQRLSD